jgi:hypothetical protein
MKHRGTSGIIYAITNPKFVRLGIREIRNAKYTKIV